MQLEKIITRKDGTKVNIRVSLSIGYGHLSAQWEVYVRYCLPKKRTWIRVVNTDDWSYRLTTGAARAEYIKAKNLEHCSDAEILEVKTSLWESIKPF